MLAGNLVPNISQTYLLEAWRVLDAKQRRTRKAILRRQRGLSDLSSNWRMPCTSNIKPPTSSLMRNGMKNCGRPSLCGVRSPLGSTKAAASNLIHLTGGSDGVSPSSGSSNDERVTPALRPNTKKDCGRIGKKPPGVTRARILKGSPPKTSGAPAEIDVPKVRRIISTAFSPAMEGEQTTEVASNHQLCTPPLRGMATPHLGQIDPQNTFLDGSFTEWMSNLDSSFFRAARSMEGMLKCNLSPGDLDLGRLLRRFSIDKTDNFYSETEEYCEIPDGSLMTDLKTQVDGEQPTEGKVEPEPQKYPQTVQDVVEMPEKSQFRKTPGAQDLSSSSSCKPDLSSPQEIFVSDQSSDYLTSPQHTALDFSISHFMKHKGTPMPGSGSTIRYTPTTPAGRPSVISAYKKKNMTYIQIKASPDTPTSSQGEKKVSPPKADVVGVRKLIDGDDVWYFFSEKDQTKSPSN